MDVELLYAATEGRPRASPGLRRRFHLTQRRLPRSGGSESGTGGAGGVQLVSHSQEGWTCVLLLDHPAAPHM